MSDDSGLIGQIGNQQIGDIKKEDQKALFDTTTTYSEIEKDLNEQDTKPGALKNINDDTNFKIKPVMTHSLISTRSADEINLTKLDFKTITEKYKDWSKQKDVQDNAHDCSLSELDNMSFEQLSVWAEYHAKSKGDDYGEFQAVADAMAEMFSQIKMIENENSEEFLRLDISLFSGEIKKKSNVLRGAVKVYNDNPKHKANPFFKKGKMRAKLCRQILTDARITNYYNELSFRGYESYYRRKDKWIKDTALKSSEQSALDIGAIDITLEDYQKDAKKLMDEAALKKYNKELAGKKDEGGNQLQADIRTIQVMNHFADEKRTKVYYHVDDMNNDRYIRIQNSFEKNGLSKDSDRNLALKIVSWDLDGNVLEEYRDADKYNKDYLDAMADGSYEAMEPFLIDMFNELMDINVDSMMTDWLNPDYFLKNIDYIIRCNRLFLRFESNILKHKTYKAFYNRIGPQMEKALKDLGGFFTYFSNYFQYTYNEKILYDPLDNRSYQSGMSGTLKYTKDEAEKKLKELKSDGTIDYIRDFQKNHRMVGYSDNRIIN